ncbi:alpha/beta-hydrolase [Flagelloscypha sp. PMI_526]|nr:alpha/beta-hydrolase [Flagelloscypha sp. PMI_526]
MSTLEATSPKRKRYSGGLLSRMLPDYTGHLNVGVCEIEFPVDYRYFGTFTRKPSPEEEPGLRMETVSFTLFYPCEARDSPIRPLWFPSLKQTIHGFLKMANRTTSWYHALAYPIAAAAVSGTTFPADMNASLMSPPNGKPWHLVIFSHGAGSSRLMYSAFCGELASRGYVVASLEHRDGTSPTSKVTMLDGTIKAVDWLDWKDLNWPELDMQPADDTILRHSQLEMRCAEIHEVIKFIKCLSQGDDVVNQLTSKPKDFDWSLWHNVDTSCPILAGHSFGGATALAVSADNKHPYKAVISMDPAVQRLEPWTRRLPHPLLVINSEEFSVGNEFKILAEQVIGTNNCGEAPHTPHVFSIAGSTHPSFSDVFLFLPRFIGKMAGLKCSAELVLEVTVDATLYFLAGKGEEICQRSVEYMPVKPTGEHLSVRDPTTLCVGMNSSTASPRQGAEIGTLARPHRPIGKPGAFVWHKM